MSPGTVTRADFAGQPNRPMMLRASLAVADEIDRLARSRRASRALVLRELVELGLAVQRQLQRESAPGDCAQGASNSIPTDRLVPREVDHGSA